jgi:hypothetical protein
MLIYAFITGYLPHFVRFVASWRTTMGKKMYTLFNALKIQIRNVYFEDSNLLTRETKQCENLKFRSFYFSNLKPFTVKINCILKYEHKKAKKREIGPQYCHTFFVLRRYMALF